MLDYICCFFIPFIFCFLFSVIFPVLAPPIDFSTAISADYTFSRSFFIDCETGNDQNLLSPWKTLAKVNYLQKSDFFQNGDAVFLKRGCIFNESLVIFKSNGDKAKPFIIGSYGSQTLPKPIITGATCLSRNCTTTYAFSWNLHKNNIYSIRISNQQNELNSYSNDQTGVITEDDKPMTLVTRMRRNEQKQGIGTLLDRDMTAGSSLFDFDTKTLYIWTSDSKHPDEHSIRASFVCYLISIAKSFKISHSFL